MNCCSTTCHCFFGSTKNINEWKKPSCGIGILCCCPYLAISCCVIPVCFPLMAFDHKFIHNTRSYSNCNICCVNNPKLQIKSCYEFICCIPIICPAEQVQLYNDGTMYELKSMYICGELVEMPNAEWKQIKNGPAYQVMSYNT